MSKTTTVVEENPTEEIVTIDAPPMTHTVYSPDGTETVVEGDRATVRAWMEEHRSSLAKGEKFLVATSNFWNYRPKGPKVKMTAEEKAAAKVRRAEERAAKKAERIAAREAKKAEVAQRKAERAEKAAAKKAERERIKAEKEAGTYQVVKAKGGAKIAVKKPSGTVAQNQALARARQKILDNKANKKR